MATHKYVYVMQRLSKILPGGREILKDITLAFFPGAKIGVLGVNGAGKSTLLRIMAGRDTEVQGECWAAEGIQHFASRESVERSKSREPWFVVVYCKACGHVHQVVAKHVFSQAQTPRFNLPKP